MSFAVIYLAPMLPAFQARIEAQHADHHRQPLPRLHRGGYRRGDPDARDEPDSNIIVRRIGQMRRVLSRPRRHISPAMANRSSPPISRVTICWSTILRTTRIPCVCARAAVRKPSVSRRRSTAMTARSSAARRWRVSAHPHPAALHRPNDIAAGRLVPILLMDWELPLLTMNVAYQNRATPPPPPLPAKIRVFLRLPGDLHPRAFRAGDLDRRHEISHKHSGIPTASRQAYH